MVIDKETQVKTESHFIEVCKRDKIKWNSKKFYEWQRMYFCGAMTVTGFTVVFWSVAIATNRPIVNY